MPGKKWKSNTGNLSAKVINDAPRMWIKYFQAMHHLTEKGQLSDQQCRNQLKLYINENGILRVHERCSNAELLEEVVLPILIPYKEHLTKLLINDTHQVHHVGTSHTFAKLR